MNRVGRQVGIHVYDPLGIGDAPYLHKIGLGNMPVPHPDWHAQVRCLARGHQLVVPATSATPPVPPRVPSPFMMVICIRTFDSILVYKGPQGPLRGPPILSLSADSLARPRWN